MFYAQVSMAGYPAVALRSAEVEVVVVPAIGMKVASLRRLRGREWLWRNDQIPLALPAAGASYVATADSGGWDECFPTVGPCALPGAPPDAPPLPDHGELWSARWASTIYHHAGGITLTAMARGRTLPYEFHREITLVPDEPLVRFRYRLTHCGEAPFPWIWSAHPLFSVQPGMRLELPTVSQVKLDAVHGRDDMARNDVVRWPDAFDSSDSSNGFTFGELKHGGWAAKLFGDIGSSGRMVLVDPQREERLEIAVDPAEVPQVGVWINCGGWAPPGRRPYYNLALEPCIGAPDRLDEAVLEWKLAQVLAPGEDRTWTVDVLLPES